MGSSFTIEQTVPKILDSISEISRVKADVAAAITERGGAVPSAFVEYGDAIRALAEENILGYVLSSGTEWPACVISFVMPSTVLAVDGSLPVLCPRDPAVTIDLNRVTKIGGNFCFGSLQNVEAVIGSNVSEISATNAFKACGKLKEAHFPLCSSFGSASSAFAGCESLTVVGMPAAVAVPYGAFGLCTSLSSIDLPACTTVGARAFDQCSALVSVSLPACTTIEGPYAFAGTRSLSRIDLPACTSIGESAFVGGASRFSISFSPSIAYIGDHIFGYDDSVLVSLYLQSVSSVPVLGGKLGEHVTATILVPSSLFSEFQAASVWSDYSTNMLSV